MFLLTRIDVHTHACGYVCSQLPRQVLPLDLHLIDTETARRRFEEFSVTNNAMAAHQNRLRSNRFLQHTFCSYVLSSDVCTVQALGR